MEVSGSRQTEWTSLLTVGSTTRRLINTSPRKVKRRPAKSVVVSVSFISSLCLDYKKGFGGSFGIQTDRVDKSAHGWEYVESVDKHASQKGETPLPCLSSWTTK